MSRYTILLLLTLPFILAGVANGLVDYKMRKSSRKRFIFQITVWLFFLTGLVVAESLYEWLFRNSLTQTDALSLFDVIQITAIIILLYVTSQLHTRLTYLEERLTNMHRSISIKLSAKE